MWMKASRGGGGRMRQGPLLAGALLLLLLSACLLHTVESVGNLIQLPRGFHLTQDLVKIVGSPNFPVKVYVMLHQKSPHILCATHQLRNAELVDPTYKWYGPRGKILSENNMTKVTPTGSLVFQNFEEAMSGVYTCFLEYKPTVEGGVKNAQLRYVVYGYREPRYYYQVTAQYHAAPCYSIHNISFEKKLLKLINKLLVDLSCEISLLRSECHRIKVQKAGLQNELFFTFSVSSLDIEKGRKPCKGPYCEASKRLSQAKLRIERFFNQQVKNLGKHVALLPEIYYIEGTLQIVRINRCFPGYGINARSHPDCSECCVMCSPGSYNPRDGIHCLQCNRSFVFGAKTCL